MQSPLRILSTLFHALTDVFRPAVEIVGPAIVAGVVIGVVVLIALAIAYAILSLEGHRIERPPVEE